MGYARRNSLTILIFLILMSSIGYVWYNSESDRLVKLRKEYSELDRRFHEDLKITESLGEFASQKDSLAHKLSSSPKTLYSVDEPAFSLSYITWLINHHHLAIDFDFVLNEKKPGKKFTTFSYTLTGESDYRNFCSLIWHLTKYPILYKIKHVSLRRSEDDERLKFVMSLEGYTLNKPESDQKEINIIPASFNWVREFKYDIFRRVLPPKKVAKPAIVVRKKPKAVEPPGLISVQQARLLSITSDKIFLKAKGGKIVSLKPGDRVKGGRLVRIDLITNEAVFQIMSGGSTQVVRLALKYD